MHSSGVQSPTLDWESANLPESWRRFKQHVKLMFTGPLKAVSEEDKCSYLLLWVGDKGRDIFNTWTLTEDQAKLLETYYVKFEEYVTPKANPIFARYKFQERMQGSGEPFEQFVTDLKLLVKDCGYADSDQMVRGRIVFATNSHKVREKLLSHGATLDLIKAIDIARSHELAQGQMKAMNSRAPANVDSHDIHAVGRAKMHREAPKYSANYSQGGKYSSSGDRARPHGKTCGNCGREQHSDRQDCPARGRQCNKCKRFDHFAQVCRSQQQRRAKPVHAVEGANAQDSDTDEQETLYIDTISKGTDNDVAIAEMEIGQKNHKVKFKLDTGAQVNIIPAQRFHKLFSKADMKPTTRRLTGYGGEPLDVKGTCNLSCKYKGTAMTLEFYIVTTKAPPVLGLRACIDMDLIKLVLSVNATQTEGCDVREEFADVFQGVGQFPGECSIRLDPTATPVVCPPRRIPFTLRSRLKDELDEMEGAEIIAKVTEPTDWVNALVVVEKPHTGKLRVCLDPRELNKAIKRPHYPLPTLEDVTPRLAGAQFFSVMDARSGYWAIKLTEDSSMLTTFNTVFGRYRFLRLPFGIVSAQDEFQRKIDETYEGLKGVAAIVDDILVYGRTREEHDANLRAMLERTRERGVRLNPEKSRICVTEVKYFGHRLTREGIKPEPDKVKAVKEMEPPQNKAELETIMGMVNYLARFAPSLSEINAPLRQLLKQSSEFVWDETHNSAFQQMKDLITREPGPVLTYFDPSKELRLQVDASKSGLGAVLLQEEKPVAYASKSLTATEENYAQIEKELFAVLFGCKRFHQYVYGRQVVVESDHKPLESIMRKPLAAAPPRLQRMILQLQKYDITIIHRPGKHIPVADTLSRKSLACNDHTLSEGMDTQVHTVISNLPVSDRKLTDIRTATEQDPQLTMLKEYVLSGWPETRKKCSPTTAEYWNHRDEISEMDGILFKGEKIKVPHSLRASMLTAIHTPHLGMEKSKLRARDILFWPGMGREIEAMVEKCTICLQHRKSNPKEPMLSHEIPDRPWQVIATDLFAWNGEDYVVSVDYYSRYFEIERLYSTTSSAVIRKLKAMFSRNGIPEKVISDNGPQYSSQDFKNFANTWDFKHTTTSPHYPQSNGLAEKTVQTAKIILDKARAEKKDPYLSLLEYRNTPVDGFKSPAQLLNSRRLRSILPTTAAQLQPQVISPTAARRRREHMQHQQRRYYNRSARPLSTLQAGDNIRYRQDNGLWRPATIMQPAHTDRSYHISTSEGQTYRRNRRHLLPTKEPTPEHTAEVSDRSDTPAPEHTAVMNDRPDTPVSENLPTDTTNTGGLASDGPAPYAHTRSGRLVKPRQVMDL